jgi:hypothetical protein
LTEHGGQSRRARRGWTVEDLPEAGRFGVHRASNWKRLDWR